MSEYYTFCLGKTIFGTLNTNFIWYEVNEINRVHILIYYKKYTNKETFVFKLIAQLKLIEIKLKFTIIHHYQFHISKNRSK